MVSAPPRLRRTHVGTAKSLNKFVRSAPLDFISISPLLQKVRQSLLALPESVEHLGWDHAAPAKQANSSVDLKAGKISKLRYRSPSNRHSSSRDYVNVTRS
jgi:hypothetical protein